MATGSLVSALALVAVLAGAAIGDVAAQASCAMPAMTLTPCLNFITGSSNGNASSPSSGCCDAVRQVVNTGVYCFCQIITTSNPFGFINRTLALTIPGLCKVSTAPLNNCEDNAGVPFLPPAPSPDSNPVPSPAENLAPAPVLSPSASPARKDSPMGPSAISGPAESPSGFNGLPVSPRTSGVSTSGSYSVGTDFWLPVTGIFVGLISARFLW